jgi:Putative cyclase
MPCQASTQWDALCHIFLDEKMYNAYDAKLVDVKAAKKLGIEHVRDKMVGRGVLLDIARFRGVDSLSDGRAVKSAELDACAAAQNVQIRKGDFVIVRTGHQERCLAKKDWSGYAGGAAPGFAFETCAAAASARRCGLPQSTSHKITEESHGKIFEARARRSIARGRRGKG